MCHCRVPGGNLGESFLDYPVELDVGNRPRRIGQRRQGMNDIAQGRGLDQQYPHSATLHQFERVRRQAVQGVDHRARLELAQAVVVAEAAGALEAGAAFQAKADDFNLLGQRRGELR
ncbi:hypothetical protein D9M73_230740 [compost metagenome]